VVAITQKLLRPDDPAGATIDHTLGGLEQARGRYWLGEPLARRAVQLRRRALGPDHPDVAADQAALAAILDGEGRRKEAERLYLCALSGFGRVDCTDRYEVAVNPNELTCSS